MNTKEKYDELIKRVKATNRYFSNAEEKYYRQLFADEFPEFFNESEVLRSKKKNEKLERKRNRKIL